MKKVRPQEGSSRLRKSLHRVLGSYIPCYVWDLELWVLQTLKCFRLGQVEITARPTPWWASAASYSRGAPDFLDSSPLPAPLQDGILGNGGLICLCASDKVRALDPCWWTWVTSACSSLKQDFGSLATGWSQVMWLHWKWKHWILATRPPGTRDQWQGSGPSTLQKMSFYKEAESS